MRSITHYQAEQLKAETTGRMNDGCAEWLVDRAKRSFATGRIRSAPAAMPRLLLLPRDRNRTSRAAGASEDELR